MKRSTRRSRFEERASNISRTILRWYSRAGRDLPWRNENNPYRILISEVMLQQTQVSRVIEKYSRFILRFPSFSSLARASTSSVIRAWRGMGYNNRAVRLRELARAVTSQGKTGLPNDTEQLQGLPGIGKYTAHAVACFAFKREVPVVDTNVRRVLGRLFPSESKRLDVWDLARAVLPPRRAYDWNQALMDFGSTICTASTPKCDRCPVAQCCPTAYRVSATRAARAVSKSSRDGLPDRIYRGRIVEVLRHAPARRFISTARIGPKIKPTYAHRDERWLVRLMVGLERDGLVELRKMKTSLSATLAR